MADNKENRIPKSSIEREQSQTCLNSAEREKIKGSKNLNVPHLRFPEFRGEWEEHTLRDVVTFSNGKAHENCVNDDGDYILVNSKFVSTNGQIQKRVTSQLSPLRKSQFVMVMSDLPNGKALAKCFYVEDDNKYTLNQRICSFTSNDGNVSRFLMYQINRNKYYMRFDDGINQTNLKKSEVLSCPVFIPTIREQEKIATLLCKIDERIATQNKVIEKLESLIKGIIYHAKTDGIRNNTWQKTELRKVLQERKEKNANGYDVCSVSVTQGVVNQIEYLGRSFAAKDTQHYNVVKYGDIVYTKSPTGDFPYGIVKRSNIKSNVAVSPLYGVYKPVNDYIGIILHFYFLEPNNALNYLHPLIQKGAKNTINITNGRFLENSIPLPKKEDETKRLAWILTTIESKIILEQNLLQSYLKQKQYLLRQMFI